MDPGISRHPPQQAQPPPLSFSRNAGSPYAPSPFQAPQNPQGPYPPSASHPPPPNSHPVYSDHQRRTSDPVQQSHNPYYPSRPGPGGPLPPSAHPQPQHQHHPQQQQPPPHHQRHQSSSSISSAPQLNRGVMPPPGSPPQQLPGPSPHHYGLPAPRAPPVSVGPPTAFPNGRELPSLNSLPRAQSAGSSMSIASMLGGNREQPQPNAQYSAPATSAAVSGPVYSSSVHASPRVQPSNIEYGNRFRPHTPDIVRSYDPRGSNAPSPQQGMHGTPEVPRYGTPQTSVYGRGPPHGPPEQYRDQRMQPAPMPPRPSSTQPKSLHNTPRQMMEMNRGPPPQSDHPMYRREEPPMKYNPEHPMEMYDDRMIIERERQERDIEMRERERHEREMEMRERERERERRERAMSNSDGSRQMHGEYRHLYPPEPRDPLRDTRETREPMEMGVPRELRDPREPGMRDPRDLRDPREIARDPRDGREFRDPRDPMHWRAPYDQRLPYDPAGPPHPRGPEYPPANGPQFAQHQAYPHPQERYPPASNAPQQPPAGHTRPVPGPGQPYESPERPRMSLHPQPQPQPPRPTIQEPGPPQQAAFGPDALYDRPRDELHATPAHARNFLQIDVNRKGRISPLPQAVQGAQPQAHGPSSEPVINNEFRRIFSGLGAAVSSPITATAHLAFPNPHRDDDVQPESEPKQASGRGKRRKAKDDEHKGDDDSTGRLTPVNHRAKRPRTHPNTHHQYLLDSPSKAARSLTKMSHHHHHHNNNVEQVSQLALVKGAKGTTPVPSPITKEFPTTHQHHLPRSKAPASPVLLPKAKKTILSKEVLDSVADRPRSHIGDTVYSVKLKTPKHFDPSHPGPSRYGFTTTPVPLPMDKISGMENCTLTVKVPRAHIHGTPLEEITHRRAVWGTDIYTDDSDVVAACIHGGWIRGAWPDEVDLSLLGVNPGPRETPEYITAPPPEGPVQAPKDLDLHVTVLILPCLEKYASTTRFGIKSREWGGRHDSKFHSTHDGLSFMIMSVRFTDGAQPQSRLRGKGRRERMRKAMEQMNRSKLFDLSAPTAKVTAAKRDGSEAGKENTRPSEANGTVASENNRGE